ncbi:MAG TPA: 2-amino-4-hydroxy-6-hydroxymethyldihydropteridine diphosphokinase [Vicinamibacterales bacterium]|jgi:2-amino-4-hydroxy-6-hydroxymethyldihydropteridine diphosphokinase|nr:2-amino-4-hydroxy-6-hydroxymethyldihydropteridine diphosphokinase [Vicinamibacterales bacterium]
MKVAIALGSNLGDREAQLRGAISALTPRLARLHVSSFHETEPVDVAGPQPRFLNAAAVGDTRLSASAILDVLLATERRFGRERPYERAPRTLDLDLILYGDQIINTPSLIVPHPRFRDRLFVLEPLAEIAAEWIDPVTGKTISQLLNGLRHTH